MPQWLLDVFIGLISALMGGVAYAWKAGQGWGKFSNELMNLKAEVANLREAVSELVTKDFLRGELLDAREKILTSASIATEGIRRDLQRHLDWHERQTKQR